ncbi:hypothetical protein CcCBS67573_g00145 [Chytriomyces confervae]|uniref:SET domain-containing protein n=1 Tax=Chytriomyces confervae TaxID=246404 RepID=A0A507FQA9_9FUNG|nr:hypothetical protein HDU80_011111 [Chytriomyces hyalinus]TPX78609.1 hypothetical protein CcCBS67573_g00145 [Chytriomyces confervae]
MDAVAFLAQDNAALYADAASRTKTQGHFEQAIDGIGGRGRVRVEYFGPLRGKGVVAETAFVAGDRVFDELALFAIQSPDNARLSRACQKCLHFVGSPIDQIELMLTRKLSAKERATLSKTAAKVGSLFTEGFAKEVNCDCGEHYCSIECRDKDAANGHTSICPSANPSSALSIAEFKEHAINTNETFLLALKVFGFIASRLKAHKNPGSVEALEHAIWPLRVFAKDYWWNVCLPNEAEEEDPEELQMALRTLLTDSTALLSKIFAHVPEMKPVINVDFYSLLMGIFERNNLSILTPSPMLPLLEHIPDSITEAIMKRASEFIPNHGHNQHSNEHDHHHHGEHGHSHDHSGGSSSNNEEVDPFEALDAMIAEGTGLHTIQGTINHSCKPNAMVFKDASALDGSSPKNGDPDSTSSSGSVIRDGRTVLRAVRPIAPGEEITISYLDEGVEEEDMDGSESGAEDGGDNEKEVDLDEKAWRALSLKEYGIDDCQCPKCKQ